MRLRWPRAIAFGGIVGAAMAAFAACDLDPNGLGEVAGAIDSSVDAPARDAGLDARADGRVNGDAGDASDAGSDVVAIDAPGEACAPLETDCTNGVDDDCNGLVDCADPACGSGYACTPTATGGFAGYSLYDDDRSTACPAQYATQLDTFEQLFAPPASCAACECAPAAGTTCGGSTLTCAHAADCATNVFATESIASTCGPFAQPVTIGPTDSCRADVPPATPGTCAASGGAATVATPSFGKLSRVCATTKVGGGCGPNAVCAPKPTGASHGVCVAQSANGATICPTSYAHAHLLSLDGGVTDDRRCTDCSCGSASGASCTGSVTLHGNGDCTDFDAGTIVVGGGGAGVGPSTTPITLAADGTCVVAPSAIPAAFGSAVLAASVAAPGSCAPDGGKPVGTAAPSAQTVFCCAN